MSLISRARTGDKQAIETMFRQFIPADERIEVVEFLGLKGLLGIGVHSFGAVTSRRAAGLEVSVLGGVAYRDGYFEHINSTAVYHPSRLLQIIVSAGFGLTWAALFITTLSANTSDLGKLLSVVVLLGLGVVGIPLIAKVFYYFVKSGVVLVVREGVSVSVFADRTRLPLANQMSQRASQLREVRLRSLRTGLVPATGPVQSNFPTTAPTSASEASTSAAPQPSDSSVGGPGEWYDQTPTSAPAHGTASTPPGASGNAAAAEEERGVRAWWSDV